jgi:hypothetical protein
MIRNMPVGMNDSIKRKTNNFGEIILDGRFFYGTTIKYNDKIINIGFHPFINFTKNKLKRFIEIIDNYIEIYEMTKIEIIKKYSENKIIKDFFKSHFELLKEDQLVEIFGVKTFDKFNVRSAVEKLEYPHFYFDSCLSKEVFLLVQYQSLLKEENYDIGLWVEIDFDEEIRINDFLTPY